MLKFKVEKKLNKLLKTGEIKTDINRIVRGTQNIVLREYKIQMPVNFGVARRDSEVQQRPDASYVVTTTATSAKGFRYPMAVHGGTGKFKGSSKDYPSYGRVRAGTVLWGIGGIRPNKFADRASKKAEPLVQQYFIQKITGLINER